MADDGPRPAGSEEEPEDPQVAALFARWLEASFEGEPPSLATLCQECPQLIGAVAAQIDAHRLASNLLSDAPDEATAWDAPPPGYRIVGEIGAGGMGTVYLALQIGLNRRVALKTLSTGTRASRSERERFRIETEALTGLKHPSIVTIHDVGEHRGRPFFTMEWIEGEPLDRRLDEFASDPRKAAMLVREVALAVQHAHERGVLHRDLKPSNILLDSAGRPHVTDFGLAKVGRGTDVTLSGSVLGTPAYMSPEQARGDSKAVTTLTDVHGLGAVLHATLTGSAPFAASFALESLRLAVNSAPPAADKLNPRVPADLATIAKKAMSKEPERRYATARDLADDLGRWLAGEPITARPASTFEVAQRWCRRHPARAGVAAASVLTLLAFSALVTWLWRSERAARQSEGVARARAEDAGSALLVDRADLASREGRLDDIIGVLYGPPPVPEGWWEARRLKYESTLRPRIVERMAGHDFGLLAAAIRPDGSMAVTAGADGRLVVWDLATARLLRLLAEGDYSDQQRRCLHHSEVTEPKPGVDYFTAVAWVGETDRIVVAALSGRASLIDVLTGKRRELFRSPDPLYAVATSADGSLVLASGRGGRVYLRSTTESASVETATSSLGSDVLSAVWCPPAGGWIVGMADGSLRLLDGKTLAERHRRRVAGPVWALDSVNDGDETWLAAGCGQSAVPIFRVDSARGRLVPTETLRLPASTAVASAVHAVRLTADARSLYGLDSLGRLILWDRDRATTPWIIGAVAPGGVPLIAPTGGPPFDRVGSTILQTRRSDRIYTGGQDGVLKRWNVDIDDGATHLQVGLSPRIAFDAEGIWTLDATGQLRRFDAGTGAERGQAQAHQGRGTGLAVGRDGEVVTVGADGWIKSWSNIGGVIVAGSSINANRPLRSVALSSDGRLLATLDSSSELVLRDHPGDRVLFRAKLVGDSGVDLDSGILAFSGDGRWLAALGTRQSSLICATSPPRVLPLRANVAGSRASAMLWDPDEPGRLVFADDALRDNAMIVPSGARSEAGLPTTTRPWVGLAAEPTGNRMFALDDEGRLAIFQHQGRKLILDRKAGGPGACGLALNPACGDVALAHKNGHVTIWRCRAAELPPAAVPRHLETTVSTLLEGGGVFLLGDGGSVAIAPDDRVGVVLIAQATDLNGEGSLTYAAEVTRGGATCRETVDDTGRVSTSSLRLVYESGGIAAVVYRRRVGPPNGNDFEVLLARRRGPATWDKEVLLASGNNGYRPSVVLRDGKIAEVFHFAYRGMGLMRTFQEGGRWHSEWFGRRGDGSAVETVVDSGGDLHLGFNSRRFNSDPGPPLYVLRRGNEVVREVIDPRGVIFVDLGLDSRGRPTAFYRSSDDRGITRSLIARKIGGTWRPEPLPDAVRGATLAAFTRDGRILLAEFRDRRVILLRQDEAGWSIAEADIPDVRPALHYFLESESRGQPLLIRTSDEKDGTRIVIVRPKPPQEL